VALRRILAALGLVIAAAVFLPPQAARMRLAADRYVFNDDARQWVVPFFDGALQDDWTSVYYRAITPAGQRALYAIAEPEALSKVLPFLLFALTCALVGMTTFALTRSGTAAAVSVCFLFSTAALMARMTGGSSRAFAFPIVAAVAYGLASGRPLVLAIATAAGAAFYPPAGMVAGVALVLSFGVRRPLPPLSYSDASPRQASEYESGGNGLRTPKLIAITVVVSAVLIAPLVVSSRGYGRGIGPADVAAYPEAGPRGRYLPADRPPFPPVLTAAYRTLDWGLKPSGKRLVPAPLQGDAVARAIALALAALGLLFGARRLLLLPAAALLMFAIAAVLAPRLYLPTRYVAYAFVILPAIALPVAAFALARNERRWPALAACIAALLLLGGTGSATAGFTMNARAEAALYEQLARSPDVQLVAGWPAGPVENVPYLARKRALLTYETHQALHTEATKLQRARMFALIDAYFATSPEPLRRLRDSFGVTHLIVDRRHFGGPSPRYFAPFDAAIATAVQRMHGQPPEVSRYAPVFALGPYAVLDLRRVR
jgi:MFS family permease